MDVPSPHALAAPQPTGGAWSTAHRIAELRDLAILDTEPEPLYDDLVRVAAHVCRVPVALVSLVDAERQWFKSEVGLGKRELPINCSVCAHTIASGSLLVIPDLTADPRTVENPLVTGPEGFRFYAGAVIQGGQGIPLGALCVLDRAPRPGGSIRSRRRPSPPWHGRSPACWSTAGPWPMWRAGRRSSPPASAASG